MEQSDNNSNNSDKLCTSDGCRTIKYPDKDTLIQMLTMEESIRMSPEYIKLCDEVKDEVNGWLRISEEIQYKIARDFGYTSTLEQDLAVNRMRRAQYLYPEEPLFKTIPVYVRNNIANVGTFVATDIVPNLMIHHISNLEEVQLYDVFSKEKPTLLLASSHT